MIRGGYSSRADLANALTTAKRIFAGHLLSVVSQYVSDKQDLDSEIQDIKNFLAPRLTARSIGFSQLPFTKHSFSQHLHFLRLFTTNAPSAG